MGRPDSQRGLLHLAERARRGSSTAWVELDRQLRPLMASLLVTRIPRRLRRSVGLEDVVQEALLRVARALPACRFDAPREFLAWVRRITLRTLFSAIVFEDRRPPLIHLEPAAWLRRADAGQVSRRRAKELADEVSLAVIRLPPLERAVIEARYLEARTWSGVAERLGRPVGSCRHLEQQARARLSRHFGPLERERAAAHPAFLPDR